ncbi:MAG: PDDEXK nuclease domain-containing protein [Prevotellaceae bacterium]|jgi:predicted nuclease of restriction endonuclease-like (RecB) superfamily|nr:PDDEXK nuclease domain-containing protein [Prevotellaceae bacterium]
MKRNHLVVNTNNGLQPAVDQIRAILEVARGHVAKEVNSTMLDAYWEIGHIVVEQEQSGELKAKYGKRLLPELSKRLTRDLGRGFSRSNLQNMRALYREYPICQTLSGKLSWSHYIELLSVNDKAARSFYEQECLNARWSVKELNRQISTSLFERLLLSKGTANQEQVLAMARRGISMESPQNIMKQPFVFEFLGVREEKPLLEKDLEAKLIRHLQDFLLELGRGFMFVGSQQRVTLGNIHYYVDMVFYNKILKAYVLIDLKMGELQLEHAGQMNGYLNYYLTEVNDKDDNPPVGIILCSSKRDVVAEYALGGLSNQIFTSSYTYYIPSKDELINEVKALLEREEFVENNDDNSNE